MQVQSGLLCIERYLQTHYPRFWPVLDLPFCPGCSKQSRLADTYILSPPLPTLAPTRDKLEEKNKGSLTTASPAAACPAPAQQEAQDKGFGQSEEDEGQRVGAAWVGRAGKGVSRDLIRRKARTGKQPSPPCTHTSLHKHLWGTCCILHMAKHNRPLSPHHTPYAHTSSPRPQPHPQGIPNAS